MGRGPTFLKKPWASRKIRAGSPQWETTMNILSKLINLIKLIKSYQYHLFLAICIGLISFISYNLGKIDALEKTPIKIGDSAKFKTQNVNQKAEIFSATKGQETSDQVAGKKLDTRVVVSKSSGSKKYHHTWCNTWKKIKLENQIWFSSDKEAEAAGYTLAGNCVP